PRRQRSLGSQAPTFTPQAQAPLKLNDITVSLGAPNPIGSLLALVREGMAAYSRGTNSCVIKKYRAWEMSGPIPAVHHRRVWVKERPFNSSADWLFLKQLETTMEHL